MSFSRTWLIPYELGFNQLMILMLKKSQIIRLAPGHDINSMKIHETLTRSPKYNILFSRGTDSKAICWDISDLHNLPLSTPPKKICFPSYLAKQGLSDQILIARSRRLIQTAGVVSHSLSFTGLAGKVNSPSSLLDCNFLMA